MGARDTHPGHLHRDLRSQGFQVGKDTVHELLAYIEDAHLVYTVEMFTPSQARRNSNPRKAYPVDPALSRTVAFAKPEDLGHRLENLVYLELRRRGRTEIGYIKTEGGFEVDFCARGPDELELVQVCADLSDPATRARELRATQAAMEETGARTATLVTLREDEDLPAGTGEIRIRPAWRWLLEG